MNAPAPNKVQLGIALILAPLFGCIFGLGAFVANGSGADPLGYIGGVAYLGGMIWLWSLPLSIPLGLAVHLALKKLNYQTHFAYTAAGLALGFPALWLFLTVLSGGDLAELDTNLWLGGITGAATALVFRLMIGLAGPATPSSPGPQTPPY